MTESLFAGVLYDARHRLDTVRERLAILIAPWIVYGDVREAYQRERDERN